MEGAGINQSSPIVPKKWLIHGKSDWALLLAWARVLGLILPLYAS